MGYVTGGLVKVCDEETDSEMKVRVRTQGVRTDLALERLQDLAALGKVLSHGLDMAHSGYDMTGLMDITGLPIDDGHAQRYIAMMHPADARADRIWLFAKALHVVTDKISSIIEEAYPDLQLDVWYKDLNNMIDRINQRKIEHREIIARAKEKWEHELG